MTLLLLAGTGEARGIADALAKQNIPSIASLAGATRQPNPLALPTRHGGFGGDDGFGDYLRDMKISAVLDATHPFAHRISARTARMCKTQNIPYAQVLRPPWTAGPGDDWTSISTEEEAAQHIPPDAVVFLATGRQSLDRFHALAGRRIYFRSDEPF